MKKSPLLAIPLLALLFASCSSTPQSRIQKNPTLYNGLSKDHQSLVRAGQLKEGMTKPAVFLAKGRADSEVVRIQKKKKIERWNYKSYNPSINPDIALGMGEATEDITMEEVTTD